MRTVGDLKHLIGDRSILVLGKGPSLTRWAFDLHSPGKCVIGINQTVRTFACDIAFFIDIEPFLESCGELLASTAAVILPWHPNRRTLIKTRSSPMQETLDDLCQTNPTLRTLDDQGRLYYFHTRFAERRNASNIFEPNLVSMSALLKILGSIHVKAVSTLGVDGGKGHSDAVKGSIYTQLRGGYDLQFPILRQIAISGGITMTRADAESVRIFVGCESEQSLAARVLEYSIRRNTSERIEFRQLHEALGSKHLTAGGRTPFSCQRYFVPELCDFKGMAIYMDSDMLVFGDVRGLVDQYNSGTAVISAKPPPDSGRAHQYSVMLINCELARWNGVDLSKRAEHEYEGTMFELDFEPSKQVALGHEWNSLELYEPGFTKLLHYTDMDRQPWLSAVNPLASIWIRVLCEAFRDGFISFEDVRRAVAAGHVRPGLLYQIETGVAEPAHMPKSEKLKDQLFVPPHTVARFTSKNNRAIRAGLALGRKVLHYIRART